LSHPLPKTLRLGASSWSSADWVGPFYPPQTSAADFLACYAQHFSTVEVDATFYRPPSAAMVRNWAQRTPPGFVFAAKFPRAITHDKVMTDCATEVTEFLGAMELLGEKLGPLLLQFPYFNRQAFPTAAPFLARLKPFLASLPAGFSYALELRNKQWIGPPLLQILRQRGVALALIDHPWMTPVQQLMKAVDPITAPFVYLRWLGDRKGIEEQTQHWDRTIVDRESDLAHWIPVVRQLLARELAVYGYFNNHYAGFAPGSIALFERLWRQQPAAGGEGQGRA
jgi:uncharacterized protein YecE (DUF72 family)